MSRPRWSGAALLAWAAAALFLGVTAWLVSGLHTAQAAAAAAVAASPSGPAAGPLAASGNGPAVMHLGQPQAGASAPVLPASALRAWGPHEFDLCGLGVRQGRIEPDSEGDAPPTESERAAQPAREPQYQLPADIERHLQDEVYAPLLATMARSPDVRQQAAGLWLGGQQPQLVDLARKSSDPLVMLWAQRTCQWQRQQGACAGLTARHWVRIEPDNQMAWLWLLNEEPAALEEALHGMAQARRADLGYLRIHQVMDTAMPLTLLGYEAAWVIDRVTGLEAAQVIPAYQGLLKACGAEAVRSANRRQTCLSVGQVMAGQATDILARMMGARVLEWAEGPSVRVQAVRQQYKAITSATLLPFDDPQIYNCASTAKRRQWARQIGVQGEWAYYVARLEARQRQPVGVAR